MFFYKKIKVSYSLMYAFTISILNDYQAGN